MDDVQLRCNPNPGEPTFEFRAQDRFAPEVLEFWATRLEQHVRLSVGDTADKSRAKVKIARAQAHRMRAWQVLNREKTPD